MWDRCVLVGAVWGFTNALMKLADASYVRAEGDHSLKTILLNWKWVLAFLANQSGSVLFYMTLKDADLSLAVPITQATTLVFTVLGAVLLGERFDGDRKRTGLGILLISIGVMFMRADELEVAG